MLPLVVWLIYGSVDWFWEMPALSGPALGFLGVAVALEPRPRVSGPSEDRGGDGSAAAGSHSRGHDRWVPRR